MSSPLDFLTEGVIASIEAVPEIPWEEEQPKELWELRDEDTGDAVRVPVAPPPPLLWLFPFLFVPRPRDDPEDKGVPDMMEKREEKRNGGQWDPRDKTNEEMEIRNNSDSDFFFSQKKTTTNRDRLGGIQGEQVVEKEKEKE